MYVLVYCLSRFQSACLEILFCKNENNLTKKKKRLPDTLPTRQPIHYWSPFTEYFYPKYMKHVCGAACKRRGSTESNCGKEGGVTEAKGSETRVKRTKFGLKGRVNCGARRQILSGETASGPPARAGAHEKQKCPFSC